MAKAPRFSRARLFARVLGCVLAALPAGASFGAVPEALSAKAAEKGSLRVIVQLAAPFVPEGRLRAPGGLDAGRIATQRAGIVGTRRQALAALRGTAHRVTREFASLPFVALDVSPAALAALGSHPLVVGIAEDAADRPTLAASAPLVEATPLWALGIDGSGLAVAVLDTGADATQPMLDSGKVVAEACFSGESNCPNGQTTQIGSGAAVPCNYSGSCSHGTHVAGIAAGASPSLDGIARGADLVSIQVYHREDSEGECGMGQAPCPRAYASDQIAALEHVLLLQPGIPIAAVNMSLAGAPSSSTCDVQEAARKAAIDNLRSVGIATVISSGNNSDPDGISSPACISTAISVGATSKQDVVWSLSNSDTFLSLLAPGVSIESAYWLGGTVFWSGTSMAAPHVAGAWALLRQHSPTASVGDVLAALQATGEPVTDARNGLTHSRIAIQAAAAQLPGAPAAVPGLLAWARGLLVLAIAAAGVAWSGRSARL